MQKYVVIVALLLHFISFQVILSSGNGLFKTKIAKVDVIKGYCHGHENVPIQFKNIHITMIQKENYFSGNFIVKQDNFPDVRMLLKSKRCTSKEFLDSCEPMHVATVDKICKTMNRAKQIWSPFINSIYPPMGCPAKNGTYVMRNGTFDLGPLINLPGIEQWYWKEQVEIYREDTNVLVACLNIEGHVIQV